MADDVTINIRTRGGRTAAGEIDAPGNALDRLGKKTDRAERHMRLFTRTSVGASGSLRLVGGAALYGGAAMGGILFLGIKKTTDAWEESRQVAADTTAVLKSTGGQAHVTAAGMNALTQSISRKAGVDDEAIQSGENMLLTFLRVRNEVGKGNDIFNRASQSAVDMAARFHTDLPSAFKQLGKALDDPVKGLTALRRSGVSFTESQVEQITTLEQSGEHLKAQRIILAALDKQVQGSAAAQATPLKRLAVSWQNIEEGIGHGLQPVVDKVATSFDNMFNSATPKIDALGTRLSRLAGRNDLTLSDKLTLGGRDAQRTLRPYERELKREIGAMDLGPKLDQAFEYAVPRLADAAGRAAPKVAGAFVNSFIHSGVYGKLFTLALLERKLGVFSALGGIAARRFSTSFAANEVIATPTSGGGGGGKGKGGIFPTLLKAGIGVELASQIAQAAGVSDADPLSFLHPNAAGGNDGRSGVLAPTRGHTPGGYPQPRGLDTKRGGRAKAGPGGRTTVVHTAVLLDGKPIAKAVNRYNEDKTARGG